jgi:hypothetical protein
MSGEDSARYEETWRVEYVDYAVTLQCNEEMEEE